MNIDFKNKNVIVTGGTRGIGAEIAKMFFYLGANVLITGTKSSFEDNTISRIENFTPKYINLDLTSETSIKNFTKRINNFDQIDVFINNAGINKIEDISEISESDWDLINKVNLKGPFLLTQSVIRKMKKVNKGKIVNISSIFSVVSKEKRVSYSSTKWGLVGFTKAASLDLAPFGILINAVSPGFVNTDLTRKILGKSGMDKMKKRFHYKDLQVWMILQM